MVAEISALHIQSCIMFLDVYTYGKALYILKNQPLIYISIVGEISASIPQAARDRKGLGPSCPPVL